MSGYDSLGVGEEQGRRIDALKRSQDTFERNTDYALSSLKSTVSDVEETVERLEDRERSATRRFETLDERALCPVVSLRSAYLILFTLLASLVWIRG
ncbi:hypothetical protein ACH4U6_16075 [Streptomyces netropsis]|uniref:hypothetical protein n=1 Tax=Streptomyces netropsis TaxID=55404 RepID=UPI00379AEAE5